MKKFIAKLMAVCLIISLLPVSALGYTVPDYAVTLNATEERVYEGESVEIYFTINTDDFLMTDMSVAYDTTYFTNAGDTTGVIEFETPEIKGAGTANATGGYDLATRYTFTAEDVTDTVEVPFTIDAADIVYSYESAKNDEPTNVADRTNTSVIIVKQYDVAFVEDDGNVLHEQTVDKGLDSIGEEDTAISVPSVSYDDYVEAGLVADYYEHVWTYNGTEYTDAEVAEFGKTGSANEITEDTTFVLTVREQKFDVTVPANDFDTSVTPDEATYGTDYTGKIHPDAYDDKYDYKVNYEIDGNKQQVDCVGDSFTIPGANITGDMILSYEKELNIIIKAYADYITGHFLITVDGAADGYTFDGNEMYKSENHNNLRAWLYPAVGITEEEAEVAVESIIFTSTTASDTAPATYDINGSGNVDISDAAIVHGAYTPALTPVNSWIKEYLSADVDKSFRVDTSDYDEVVDEYKGRN